MTYDAGHSASAVGVPCAASGGRDEAIVSCSSKVSSAYSSTITFEFIRTPRGQSCVTEAMNATLTAKPRSEAAFRRLVKTVSNSPLPTTSVLVPATGATVAGSNTTLDASATNASSVEFWLFGARTAMRARCSARPR